MQHGNRKQLDSDREAIRDAFDAVWLASPVMGAREARAARCAIKLDVRHCNWNSRIMPGVRSTPSGEIVRRGRDCFPVIYA